MISMIVLFANFYVHEYIRKSNIRKEAKLQNGVNKKSNGSTKHEKTQQNGSHHHENKKIK